MKTKSQRPVLGGYILVVVSSLMLTALASAQVGTLSGHARIHDGHSLPIAPVLVHEDLTDKVVGSLEQEFLILRTDGEGRFSATLEDGLYDVCVLFYALIPECRKVRIRADRVTHVRFELRAVGRFRDEVVDVESPGND